MSNTVKSSCSQTPSNQFNVSKAYLDPILSRVDVTF